MIKRGFFGMTAFIAGAILVFSLAGCNSGGPFTGTWIGNTTETDEGGESLPALVVFTQTEWMLSIPMLPYLERGTYTYSGNNAAISGGIGAGTAVITSGTLTLTFSDFDEASIKFTQKNPSAVSLNANTWVDGTITASAGLLLYSFNAVNGTTYNIWTNDSYSGDGSKSIDSVFHVFNSDGHSYGNGDDCWEYPFTFTATSSGRVFIAVSASIYSSSQTGSFAAAYSTSASRP